MLNNLSSYKYKLKILLEDICEFALPIFKYIKYFYGGISSTARINSNNIIDTMSPNDIKTIASFRKNKVYNLTDKCSTRVNLLNYSKRFRIKQFVQYRR